MSLRINTNVAALNSYNNLNANQTKLEASFQQLSSGLRINKAADDAAGLSIAQGLTSQINGLTQGVSNANDGINVAQIADGALGTTQDILQRMRGLVVKAGNEGTQDSKSLGAIQQEITNLNSQLDNISSQTKFGQTNLLDGSYKFNFQVGANGGDTIALDLTGANVVSSNVANTRVDLNKLNIANGIQPTNLSGFTIDAAGAGQANTGAALASLAATAPGVAFSKIFGSTLTGGVGAGANQVTISTQNATTKAWTITDSTTKQALGQVSFDSGTGIYSVTDMSGNALASITSSVNNAAFTNADMKAANINGAGSLHDALINAGVTTAASDTISGNATDGWTIATSAAVTTATVSLQNGVYTVTNAAAATKVGRVDTNPPAATASGVISSYTSANATSDLGQIDRAIDGISQARSQIGAVQNQLGYTVSNLQTAITNVTASRSNLTDADLAQQVTAMTQSQILTQAATSVLAQANSAPQAILKLLQ